LHCLMTSAGSDDDGNKKLEYAIADMRLGFSLTTFAVNLTIPSPLHHVQWVRQRIARHTPRIALLLSAGN
jgi:hypothetical protein